MATFEENGIAINSDMIAYVTGVDRKSSMEAEYTVVIPGIPPIILKFRSSQDAVQSRSALISQMNYAASQPR